MCAEVTGYELHLRWRLERMREEWRWPPRPRSLSVPGKSPKRLLVEEMRWVERRVRERSHEL